MSEPPSVVVTISLPEALVWNPYISGEDAEPISHAFPLSLTLKTLPADLPDKLNCPTPTDWVAGTLGDNTEPNFNILIDYYSHAGPTPQDSTYTY